MRGKYAERYKVPSENLEQAPSDRWFFLTGPKEEMLKISVNGFRLGAEAISSEERTQPDQMVRHSSKFVLVDSHGRIRGYYDTEDQQNGKAKILKDARSLLSE